MQQKQNYKQLINSKQKVSISDIAKGSISKISEQYQIISLPSKGWGYPQSSILSSGELKLKYATGKDEALLSSQHLIKKGVMIDQFLKALILDNIDYQDILVGDKNYITFAARRLAFGNDYNVQIECQKCGSKQKINVDLSTIPVKETPQLFELPKGQSVFQFQLPISKKNVLFKLNNVKLQKEMENKIKLIKRPDMEIITRTAILIESIGEKTTFKEIVTQLENIPSRDTLALRNYIRKISPDIEIKYKHECQSCFKQQEVYIPITVQFFWPSNIA